MKKTILIVCFISLFVGVCSVMAFSDEYITGSNIHLWKQESEKYIKEDVEINKLKKILYQAQWPEKSVSAQDKAYLEDFQKRATKVAYNKANRLYASGDYNNALNFYQVVESHETQVDKSDLVKSYLNISDIMLKQSKKGAVNKITKAISKSSADNSIVIFIDKNINRLSYTDVRDIACSYSTCKQYTIAIKYFQKAKELAPNEAEQKKMDANIANCQSQGTKVAMRTECPTVQVSQASYNSAKQLFASAIKKYNYSDYSGALNDLEQAHKINPNSKVYDLVYPMIEISLNHYQNAIKALDKVVYYEIEPFTMSSSNYHAVYELRGSLKMVSGDYSDAVSDFKTALKNSYDEYSNAYEGLIVALLMNGNITEAKTYIEKYNRRTQYYQFADCTTYPDKIIFNIGYKDKIIYNNGKNTELLNYILNNNLDTYAYKVSNHI